jgi:hypothetical protein
MKLLTMQFYQFSHHFISLRSTYSPQHPVLKLVGKPEGKRPLGRPRRRWVDNIKMDLIEIGSDDTDWIKMVQDRDQWRAFVSTVMNIRVP